MIKQVIDKLQPLEYLYFLPKYGGLVRTARKKVVVSEDETTELLFPVSLNTGADCYETGEYRNLVPDTDQRSIVYIEQTTDIEAIEKPPLPSRYNIGAYGVTVRIVVWLNLPKLGHEHYAQSIEPYLTAVFGVVQDAGYDIRRVLVRDEEIFSKYAYDDRILSKLGYPYDFFAVDVDATMRNYPQCDIMRIPGEINCGFLHFYPGWRAHGTNAYYSTLNNEIWHRS